jgi:hypothetical protein
MKLDYSPPPFTVHLGNFEITKYVTSWEMRSPALELNTLAAWTGDFEVFFSNRFGLTENDFSEQYFPARWRTAQAQVLITVMGRSLPVMRIDRYAYDPQTRTGKGSLVQYLGSIAGNRPSAIPDTKVGAQMPLKEVVEVLVDAAMEPARIKKFREITGITGTLDAPLSTRDPIVDAQKFCGVNWQWLTVNSTEKIVTVGGDPAKYPVLMYRSIGQVEWQPDHDAIYFAADKVIVTGACQVPDPGKPCGTPNPNVDEKGRTKRVPTTEMQPFKTIFPGPYSSNPTVAEEKMVMFAYRNEPTPGTISFGISSYINFITFETGNFDPYDLMRDLDSASSIALKDVDEKTAIHTVTVKSWPAGRIFPRLGANTNLHVVEIEVVSPFIRAVWTCEGLLRPETGDNFTLVRKSREVLSADRNHGCGGLNPKTGTTIVFEDKPKAELPQPAPLVPLKTVSIRAECVVDPAGWVPLIKNPHIVEVGFLPSQGHGDNLAVQIANQQVRRRNLVHVSEPLRNAIEWLDAGCPVVGRVRIHDGEFGFESVIVGMGNNEAKFSIACGRMALINPPIAPPPQPVPYIPSSALQLIIPSSIASQVGVPIAVNLVAVGGNP